MNKNDIISNILPDENPATGTNINMDAIRWAVKKATYTLQDIESYFHLPHDQQYPDNEKLDILRLNFEKISAELEIVDAILGKIFELAEH